MEQYLNLNAVTKQYKKGEETINALSSATFAIPQGLFAVILGPSGSGKSTLLNLLGGMDRATSGQILVDGADITKLTLKGLTDYRRTDVGFIFQFYNLIPSLNVYENVDMAARLVKKPLDAKEALAAVGLEKRMKHFPAELSGGELQRTSIARAICKNPKILLCDEPTGALDSQTGMKILGLLHAMSKNYGKTVVVVTHNAAIAPAADLVVRLKDGAVASIDQNPLPLPVGEVVW